MALKQDIDRGLAHVKVFGSFAYEALDVLDRPERSRIAFGYFAQEDYGLTQIRIA